MALRPGRSLRGPCPNGHKSTSQQALMEVPCVPTGTSSLKDSVANSHLKEAGLKFPTLLMFYKLLDSAGGRVEDQEGAGYSK